MDNRKWQSGAAGSAPAVEASPSTGFPTDGNPGTATPATVPGARWFHQVGEELRNLISAAGLTPSDSDLTQLQQAISALIIQGGIKTPVRAATTANIATLAGGAPNSLDGVTLAVNDRILVKDQATGSQNGIYVVTTLGTGANGTWSRATDADGVGELFGGMLVVVQEGTVSADSIWELATDGAITIETTAINWIRKDAFATSAEAQAYSVQNKAISPATLAAALQGSNQSLSASGYQRFPGGLIIQWGTGTSSGTARPNATVTFPIAFPTACRYAEFIPQNASSNYQGMLHGAPTTTQATAVIGTDATVASAINFYWLAIGH